MKKRAAIEVDAGEGLRSALEAGGQSDEDLLWLLKRAFHRGLHTINEAMAKHGVATTQLGLMRVLADNPGASGADLARQLLITPQGAQLAIAALERRGFVERRPDSRDKRVLRAYLTRDGRKVVNACVSQAVDAHNDLFDVLDKDEQETFRQLLVKFLDRTTDGEAEPDPLQRRRPKNPPRPLRKVSV